MGAGGGDIEPFLAMAGVRVSACGPERAIVTQPATAELENHVAVRHASALNAAGYAAARALAGAAVAASGSDAELRLRHSEIAYKAMGLGELATVAEPADEGWEAAIEQLRGGEVVALRCVVITRNEQGQVVAELSVEWAAAPRG
ncbi:MAG TPA: DUF4442 domain-containing protein [Solirubrobacterales bacterium]|jgi:hypothetical protein|nr:DUF4442 domain-containing protein [Solirubrobacterales bacterium]